MGSSFVSKIKQINETLYYATRGGLSISRNGGKSFFTKTMAEGLPSNQVLDFAVSADGQNLVVLTSDYFGKEFLAYSKDEGESFHVFAGFELSQYEKVGALAFTPHGNFLLGTSFALHLFTDGFKTFENPKFYSYYDNESGQNVSSIHIASTGAIYVGLNHRHAFVSMDEGVSFKPLRSVFDAQAIAMDRSGVLYMIDSKNIISVSKDQGESSEVIADLSFHSSHDLRDFSSNPNGDLMVLFMNSGLFYIRSGSRYRKENFSEQKLELQGFVWTSENEALVATQDGVWKFLPKEQFFFKVSLLADPLSGRSILTSLVDDEGNIFLGVSLSFEPQSERSGLSYSLDHGTSFSDPNELQCGESLIKKILRDKKTGFLYVLTKKRFCVFEQKGEKFELRLAWDHYGVYLNGFALDSLGNIYLATQEGLFFSSHSKVDFKILFRVSEIASSNASQRVLSVAIDSKNWIFIATDVGLFVSTGMDSTFSQVSLGKGLGEIPISNVFITQKDELYLASYYGIFYSSDRGKNFLAIPKAQGVDTLLVKAKKNGDIYFLSKPSNGKDHMDSHCSCDSGIYNLSTLYQIQDHKIKEVKATSNPGSMFVTDINIDDQDHLWVSTGLGLVCEE